MPKLILQFAEIQNGDHTTKFYSPTIKCTTDARYENYLGGMLIADVGAHDCDELLARVKKASSGDSSEYEFVGNEWSTSIDIEGVTIEHQYIEHLQSKTRGRFTLAEFESALRAWKKFLAMDPPSRFEVTI